MSMPYRLVNTSRRVLKASFVENDRYDPGRTKGEADKYNCCFGCRQVGEAVFVVCFERLR